MPFLHHRAYIRKVLDEKNLTLNDQSFCALPIDMATAVLSRALDRTSEIKLFIATQKWAFCQLQKVMSRSPIVYILNKHRGFRRGVDHLLEEAWTGTKDTVTRAATHSP